MGIQKQADVFLIFDHLLLFIVIIIRGRPGVVFLFFRITGNLFQNFFASFGIRIPLSLPQGPMPDRTNLIDQIAKHGIWLLMYQPRQSDTYLRTVVSAQHRPVLNEGHLTSQPGCSNRGATSGHSPSDYYKIKFPGIGNILTFFKVFVTEGSHCLSVLGRFKTRVGR